MAEATNRYLGFSPMAPFFFNSFILYFFIYNFQTHKRQLLCLFCSTLYLLRYAVITGANKGIGLEICRQLAANGVIVVLTARDEKRGVEALESLKGSGLSNVVFHQLDVGDPASIASLADFIKTQFGKLDILVSFKPSFPSFFFSGFLLYKSNM